MSDIRTKILLGTTISAVSVMLVFAVSFAAIQTNSPTANSALGVMGHLTVTVTNPDGSMHYAQGDNTLVGAAKKTAAQTLFDASVAATTFTCMQLGNGTFSAASDGNTTPLLNSLVGCDGTADTSSRAGLTDGAGYNLQLETDIITVGEDCSLTCLITEAALGETGSVDSTLNNPLSHVDIVDITVSNGASVNLKYNMTTGGP